MNCKKLILILLISFLNCKRNDSEIEKLRGNPKIPEQMKNKIPNQTHQLIKTKSLNLIDSILTKTSISTEIGFGFIYSNDELGYLNTYKIDSAQYKIIEIRYDLDLNVVDWDTVIYVP